MNGEKIVASWSAGIPIPLSRTENLRLPGRVRFRVGFDLDQHLSSFGELDCIADEIDEDLADPQGIADEDVWEIGRKTQREFKIFSVRTHC